MAQAVLYREYGLPWTTATDQERRFKRLLVRVLGAVLALSLLLSVLPVREPDPDVVEAIPPRLARLVVERPEPPPPPPAREAPEPEPEPVEQRRAEPQPTDPPPEPVPAERVEQARARARSAGVLPFAEQLSALRENDALERLDDGAERSSAAGDTEAGVPERSLIASRAGGGSGGIDTASLSRETGGAGLAARRTTRVDSPVDEVRQAGGAEGAAAARNELPSRSREEIERVFDRNKGAIYALYNRALRRNPALEGKLVLRLTIAPDGRVTSCEVVSSELGDPDLEERLVQRVLLFQFESKDVEPITTTKPIDFFPG